MELTRKEQWDENDILNLITNKAEENIHLEFKSAGSLENTDKKKFEITKDIAAFANADGGILIYGIEEENHIANRVSFIDGTTYTKEWLENIVTGGIYRNISDLRILPVRFGGLMEQTVYVVDIPISYDAPHMNKEKRFYKRNNFQVLQMEEYEIRELYNRKSKVALIYHSLEITLKPKNPRKNYIIEFDIDIKIENNSKGVAKLYKSVIGVGGRTEGLGVYAKQGYSVCSNLSNGYLISSILNPPIFPGEVFSNLSFTISFNMNNLNALRNFKDPIFVILFEGGEIKTELTLRQFLYERISNELRRRELPRLPPFRQ